MFSETAELYDLIYGQFKDYRTETARVAALLRELHPSARRVLDVGCGSGEHARLLTEEHGYRVDGIDLEPVFVRLAREKCPGGAFFHADMLDFSVPTRYDAVLCLFSSIGYARTLANVTRALLRFREHLAPGGVVVVEPWFEPDDWQEGFVHAHLAEGEGIKVCRMSNSRVRDGVSVLEFHYLIGRAEGIEHRREVHELGLFTAAEMRRAFADAGLEIVRHDPEGLIGRGLFAARAA
jgi:SAM-dependent methyltransferase